MKLWIDDVRTAPVGYEWCKSVNETLYIIKGNDMYYWVPENIIEDPIELIDLDHDAGDYEIYGGDYIEILNWLEKTGRNYPIRIHSMNPVGVANMRAIIERNGWIEVK